MGIPIIGVQSAQRARKKPLPKGKTSMTITPGWEPEVWPTVEQRDPRILTDAQKKLKRLQRA